MVNFESNGKIVKLPTSISELKKEYLLGITKEIVIANNYSLIALCHREKLSTFIMAGTNRKNKITTSVVPIFVKQGLNTLEEGQNSFCDNLEVGDKLLIESSQIAIGLHVNVPLNILTMDYLMKIITGDKNAYSNSINYKDPIYFIEFKIIPNCNILGVYKDNLREKFDNPFKVEYKNK